MSDPTDPTEPTPHPDAVAASEAIAPDAPPEPVEPEQGDDGSQGSDEPSGDDSAPEGVTEALDAGGSGQPFVGTDPIYENAANPTERPLETPDEFKSEAERITEDITADRAKRDRHIGGVTGYTRDSIAADKADDDS